MSNEASDFGDCYLGDGIYSDPDLWEATDLAIERRKSRYLMNRLLLEGLDRENKNFEEYKDFIFRFAVRNCLNRAVRKYCKIFNVSKTYCDAVINGCILSDVVINSIHIKEISLTRESEIIIQEGLKILINNKAGESSYTLVGKIQYLIHTEVSKSNFKNYHLMLERDFMSELLSFCRLYFMVLRVKRMSLQGLINEIHLFQESEKFNGYVMPTYVYQAGRSYNKGWSKRHNKSMLFYYPYKVREFIKTILKSKSKSKEALRDELYIIVPVELCI